MHRRAARARAHTHTHTHTHTHQGAAILEPLLANVAPPGIFGGLFGRPAAGIAGAVLVAVMVGLGKAGTDPRNALHNLNALNNTVVHDLATALLSGLPTHSIVLCSGDLNYYPLLYLQACQLNPIP